MQAVVAPRTRAITATIDLFADWQVAIFPGPYGEKGTRVEGWPNLPPADAAEITRREAARQRINVVVRTGPEIAAIDIDGGDGVDPRRP